MSYEMLSLNYKFSEDYELLYKLLQKQIIVCFIDYNSYDKKYENQEPLYDVCTTQRHKPKEGWINISSRGHGYLTARNKEEFIEECKLRKLKYIPPQK